MKTDQATQLKNISTSTARKIEETTSLEENELEVEVDVDMEPDFASKEEFISYRHKEELLVDLVHYRELRKMFGNRVFFFMCVWCAIVFAIVIMAGCRGWFDFKLADGVLITLIGGTTASVIGLVGFVIQGLFHSK
jgi:hypothetical protein